MRTLSILEISTVAGGENTAPTCNTVSGSSPDGSTVSVTVCECPTGTTLSTSSEGNSTTMTCKPGG